MRFEISLHNVDSGKQLATITNSEGLYSIPVVPGTYELEIKARAFKPFRQTKLSVGEGATLTIEAILELESQIESVTVVDSETHLDASSAEIGGELSEKKISSVC